MTTFLIVAVVLGLLTAAWVLRPLWSSGQSRGLPLGLGVAFCAAAIGLYLLWSRWSWPADAPSVADTPAAMVKRLAKRLENEPEDVAGWLMLGRSYVALEQFPLALRAYQRADRLEGGRNAEALVGMAEAMVLQADGVVDERAGRIFEQALLLAPDSERALFFAGVAAQRRGDAATAIARFQSLLALNPPENIRPILEQQIAVLQAGVGAAAQSAVSPQASSGVQASSGAPAASGAQARVRVSIAIAPAFASRVTPGATLFVFVRKPGQPGPPLAVKRLPAALPVTVELGPEDSMVPGLAISAGDGVEVSAKISADGSATPRSGDVVGRVAYTVGKDGLKPLLIDGLTP
jgi:cytochrome c-type biogenesis protein CcmH